MKKTPEILKPLGGVYRVPLKRVFAKRRFPGDASWDETYGNKRCLKCHKHFQEGDAYTVIVTMKKNSKGEETYEAIHKYQHVGC